MDKLVMEIANGVDRIFIQDPYCKGHDSRYKKECKCHFWPDVPEGMDYFRSREGYKNLREWYLESYIGVAPNNETKE